MSEFNSNWFADYFDELAALPKRIEVTDASGASSTFDEGLAALHERLCTRIKETSAKIMFVGNGASAAISSHMAVDYCKRGGLRAISFNDSALLTCISNDCGYEQVFATPIQMLADAADLLIAISSSGRSPNIIQAAEAAREIGCCVITLSGFEPSNPLRKLGDMNFYVPSREYGFVEILHESGAALHGRFLRSRTRGRVTPMATDRAVFLDRDGVINVDRGKQYVRSWEDFEFLPGTLEALALLAQAEFHVFVVTNQSCIGRGLVGQEAVDQVHAEMVAKIRAAGGRIDHVVMCPHAPEENCRCRKPRPGLFTEAIDSQRLAARNSYLVGDSIRDLEAARGAGVRPLLVLTGHGQESHDQLAGFPGRDEVRVFEDLLAAARWLVEQPT